MERKQMGVDSISVKKEEYMEGEGSMRKFRPKASHSSQMTNKKEQKVEASEILEMNKENILRGIIFSEVLGAPRARRRR